MSSPNTNSESKPSADAAMAMPSISKPSSTAPLMNGCSAGRATGNPKATETANVASQKSSIVNASSSVHEIQGPLPEIKKNRNLRASSRPMKGSMVFDSRKISNALSVRDRAVNNKPGVVKEGPVTTLSPSISAPAGSAGARASRSTPSSAKKVQKASKSKPTVCASKSNLPRDREKQQATGSESVLRPPSPRQEVRKFVKILPAMSNQMFPPSSSLQVIANAVTNDKKHLTSHSEGPGNSNSIKNSFLKERPFTGIMTQQGLAAPGGLVEMANKNIPTAPVAIDSKMIASNSIPQNAKMTNRVKPGNTKSRVTPVVVGLPNIHINSVTHSTTHIENAGPMNSKFVPAEDKSTSNGCDMKNPDPVNTRVKTSHGAQDTTNFAPKDSSVAKIAHVQSHNAVFDQRHAVSGHTPKNISPSDIADKCITSSHIKQPDESQKPTSMSMQLHIKPVLASKNSSQPSASNRRNTSCTLIDRSNCQPDSQASFQLDYIPQSANSTKDIDSDEIMASSKDKPFNLRHVPSDDNAAIPSSLEQKGAVQFASTSKGPSSQPLPVKRNLFQTSRAAVISSDGTTSASESLKDTKSRPVSGTGGTSTAERIYDSIQAPAPAKSQSVSKIESANQGQETKCLSNPQNPMADADIEVTLPYGRIRTMKMTEEDMNRHIPVWNTRLQYKLAGTSAPLGRNLVSYLEKKMGEYELYENQDKGKQKKGKNGGMRVTLWNKVELRKISGTSAPLKKNLEKYLKDHPHCEVYEDQAERLHPAERSRLQNQNRVTLWNKVSQRRTGFGSAGPLRKNLSKYLALHPHLEEYKGQDRIVERVVPETEAEAEAEGIMDYQEGEALDHPEIWQSGLHQQFDERWRTQSPHRKRACDSSLVNAQFQENQDPIPNSSIPIRSPKLHCPIDLSHVPDLNEFPVAPADGPAYPGEWYEKFCIVPERSQEDLLTAPVVVLGVNGQYHLVDPEADLCAPVTDIQEFFRQQLPHTLLQQETQSILNVGQDPIPEAGPEPSDREEDVFNSDNFLNFDADLEPITREDYGQAKGNAS